ncbi:MAG: N-acetyltransferase [Pseudomonadota bacterium]
MTVIVVRPETPADQNLIDDLITAAFRTGSHSNHNEAQIVRALRCDGDLTLSLVAERAGGVVGHVAFSPVTIAGEAGRWFGLGPLAVRPDQQGQGAGTALVKDGLAELVRQDADGCVVLGDPKFYGRFGFAASRALSYGGAPWSFVQYLAFDAPAPSGEIAYARGFDLANA